MDFEADLKSVGMRDKPEVLCAGPTIQPLTSISDQLFYDPNFWGFRRGQPIPASILPAVVASRSLSLGFASLSCLGV